MIANTKSTAGHDPDHNNGTDKSHASLADTAANTAEESSEKKLVSESAFKKQLSAAKLPKKTREFMNSRLIAANFGNIVTVLMQSPGHQNRKLIELRQLVLPALLNNQFRVAEAHKKDSGYMIPVGLVLWARVSEDVDKRLSDTDAKDIKMTAEDWTSGDNLWLIEAVGEQRFIAPLLKDLRQKEFKDKQVKFRRKTEKGVQIIIIP